MASDEGSTTVCGRGDEAFVMRRKSVMRPGQLWCWDGSDTHGELYYLVLSSHDPGRWNIVWLHEHHDTLVGVIDEDQVMTDQDRLIQDVGDL